VQYRAQKMLEKVPKRNKKRRNGRRRRRSVPWPAGFTRDAPFFVNWISF